MPPAQPTQPAADLPSDENLPQEPSNAPDESEHEDNPLSKEIAKLVESVPKEQRAEVIGNLLEQMEISQSESMMMAKMTHFSGPMPHPDILRGMEEVVPGAAKQVIDMALSQSTHRKALETIAITSQTQQSGRGQILGFIIAMFGLGGSFYLVSQGHDAAGAVIGGIDLVALVSVFVLGQGAQKKDLQTKKDE